MPKMIANAFYMTTKQIASKAGIHDATVISRLIKAGILIKKPRKRGYELTEYGKKFGMYGLNKDGGAGCYKVALFSFERVMDIVAPELAQRRDEELKQERLEASEKRRAERYARDGLEPPPLIKPELLT